MPFDLVTSLGTVGTVLAMAMFAFQAEQIWLNVKGAKGPLVGPILITLNCIVWMVYAVLKSEPDWFLFVANVPGPLLGPVSFYTALRSRSAG